MKANDRARLTTALREHVAKIAADLRAKMRTPGAVRERAVQLHADERVAEDFDVWTDLLSRRAAVLWVLKSVYVRVLEDRGLLSPGRLLDLEAQQLFERLAPHLGETAFLRWIYRDLASQHGGLPELFSPQPAEVAAPSDELSRSLIAFWRHRDADTGAVWSFAEERFEGELMGDLYQDLDPVVKDRFALCQTPDFVRAFILDRTLTPAIATFGADEVRLLDPACGSGHFLIDGLKRLVAATAAKHSDWNREKLVAHALGRVVGIDLNDYACALARTRLIMTAAEMAGVTKLADAARFHPHVYWADGLEQVEREEHKPMLQTGLFQRVEEKPRATLTRSDVRAALRKLFATKFHAVVANPPYIVEPDRGRKDYHREDIGRRRRFVTAFKDYGLGNVFTERCFQLAEDSAFVGVITANNFMKGEAGKPFIENVLAGVDLSLVVDLSGAILAHSGFETPTVMLFARNQRADKSPIRTVIGKSGDTARPADLSTAAVWSSVVAGWHTLGFENDFVHVDDLPRSRMAQHPWVLHVGDTSDLIATIESKIRTTVGDFAEPIGFASFAGLDEPFCQPKGTFRRLGYGPEYVRPLIGGTSVRDWCFRPSEDALTPYGVADAEPLPFDGELARPSHLWRYRSALNSVSSFSGDRASEGMNWWHWYRWIPARYRVPMRITFPDVATHNHFALERGGFVFNQSALVIRLKEGEDESSHLDLLGFLNSSLAAFWLRNNAKKVGGRSSGTKKQAEPWAQRLRFPGGLVERLPYLRDETGRVRNLAAKLEALAREVVLLEPGELLERGWSNGNLASTVRTAEQKHRELREQTIALQEEIDWTIYVLCGLAPESELVSTSEIVPLRSEHRPFAIRLARGVAAGELQTHWFLASAATPSPEVPQGYDDSTRERLERRLSLASKMPLRALESPEYKRKWEPYDWSTQFEKAAYAYLADRLEAAFMSRVRPVSAAQVAAAVQDEERFLEVASMCEGRRDIDVLALVSSLLNEAAVPNHPFHLYTSSGLLKRLAWNEIWALQRREDAGEHVERGRSLPEFSQGSRGKSTDFLRTEYWQLRGKLDVPRERFIAFTEVPGRSGVAALYGWAGWTAQQRVRAILAIDEELEDAAVPLGDRVGLLDTAWRLVPDVAREDAAAAARLKAELQSLVGPEGPSRELIEDWKKRFPPPTAKGTRTKKAAAVHDDVVDSEESDES